MSDENTVIFPRNLLKQFILMYKELNCLWDRDSPDYKLKSKKQAALSKMTELVQQYDPNATRVHILRKIDSLRSCVRREYRRVKESRRIASSEDDVYKPMLWYYDLLSFIFKEDDTKVQEYAEYAKSERSMEHNAASEEEEGEEEEEEEEEEEAQEEDQHDSYDSDPYPGGYNIPTDVVEGRERASSSKRLNTSLEEGSYKIKRAKTNTEVADEYDAIGINVAAKLRYLPSNMRILAEKLINDVLFQAQTNGLNSSTTIVTTDPFKQEIHSNTLP